MIECKLPCPIGLDSFLGHPREKLINDLVNQIKEYRICKRHMSVQASKDKKTSFVESQSRSYFWHLDKLLGQKGSLRNLSAFSFSFFLNEKFLAQQYSLKMY